MHSQGRREPMNSLLSLTPTDKLTIMNIQPKETNPKAKSPLFAGIDVGVEELILVIHKNGKPLNPKKFANTPSRVG